MTHKAPSTVEGNITTGNSPLMLELASTHEHPIRGLSITNTGSFAFTVQLSHEGDAFGDVVTIPAGESYPVIVPTTEGEAATIDRMQIIRGNGDSSFKVIFAASRVDFHTTGRILADTSNVPAAISLNSSTSTTVAAANSDRNYFTFGNTSGNLVWLKEQAATVDNDKKGIPIFGRTAYEAPTDNPYTGEYSAIADTGSPEVNVTEH